MKNLIFLMVVVFISVTMTNCTKEGPVGPKGPAGTNGLNGNANVTTYFFTDSTQILWSGSTVYLAYDSTSFFIPDSIFNYGAILVYHKVKDVFGNYQMWYPVPGLGYNALYSTRLYINQLRIEIRAYDPDGSTWSGGTLPQLDAIKVILISPSTVYMMQQAGVVVNFDDYAATMDYFGLEK